VESATKKIRSGHTRHHLAECDQPAPAARSVCLPRSFEHFRRRARSPRV